MAYERYDDMEQDLLQREMRGGSSTQPVGEPMRLMDSDLPTPAYSDAMDRVKREPGYAIGGGSSMGFDVPDQHKAGMARAQRSMAEDGLSSDQQRNALGGLAALGGFAGGGSSGNPLGGSNTGVAGGGAATGSASGGLSPMAGGAMARYGTADIEGADSLTWGSAGKLEGFNTNAWGTDERGSNTIKNSFGKIASRYDVSQPGAVKAVMADPDFQRLFPEAKLVEHPNADLIDFGDGKPVDVIRAARAGGAGEAWQWGADAGGAQGGGTAGISTPGGLLSSDPMAGINGAIDGLVAGRSPDEQNIVQAILRGEL